MVKERDIVEFLKARDRKASLNEIAEGLGIPKYGPDSAYAFLQSLKTNGVIERRGEQWTLIAEVADETPSPPHGQPVQAPPPEAEKVATTPEVEQLIQARNRFINSTVSNNSVPLRKTQNNTIELATLTASNAFPISNV